MGAAITKHPLTQPRLGSCHFNKQHIFVGKLGKKSQSMAREGLTDSLEPLARYKDRLVKSNTGGSNNQLTPISESPFKP